MTRAEARAFLIELGVAEPTEAQVSLYLNTANANRQQQQQPQNNAELERLRGIEQQYQTLLNENNGADDRIANQAWGSYTGRGSLLADHPRLKLTTWAPLAWAALAWQLVTLRRQVADAEFRKEALSQEVQQRQEENASLQESIDQGGSLEEMLRIAREKLGLVAPNEKVFYDTAN